MKIKVNYSFFIWFLLVFVIVIFPFIKHLNSINATLGEKLFASFLIGILDLGFCILIIGFPLEDKK